MTFWYNKGIKWKYRIDNGKKVKRSSLMWHKKYKENLSKFDFLERTVIYGYAGKVRISYSQYDGKSQRDRKKLKEISYCHRKLLWK
mgnify:FL=1